MSLGSPGLKRRGTALSSPGWGYVWVTWRLLVFGRVSAASVPGEKAVTTRVIVAVAVAAAAPGGREEVGHALRGV